VALGTDRQSGTSLMSNSVVGFEAIRGGDLRGTPQDKGHRPRPRHEHPHAHEHAPAFTRLSHRMTVVRSSARERQRWARVFAKVRSKLARGTFDAALVRRLEALAAR